MMQKGGFIKQLIQHLSATRQHAWEEGEGVSQPPMVVDEASFILNLLLFRAHEGQGARRG